MNVRHLTEKRGLSQHGAELEETVRVAIRKRIIRFFDSHPDAITDADKVVFRNSITKSIISDLNIALKTLYSKYSSFQPPNNIIKFEAIPGLAFASTDNLTMSVKVLNTLIFNLWTQVLRTNERDSITVDDVVNYANNEIREMVSVILHEFTHVIQHSNQISKKGERVYTSKLAKSDDEFNSAIKRIHTGEYDDSDIRLHTGSLLELGANVTDHAYKFVRDWLIAPDVHNTHIKNLTVNDLESYLEDRLQFLDPSKPKDRALRNRYLKEFYLEITKNVQSLKQQLQSKETTFDTSKKGIDMAVNLVVTKFFNKTYERLYKGIPVDEDTPGMLQEDLGFIIEDNYPEPSNNKERHFIKIVTKRAVEYIMPLLEHIGNESEY